MAFGEEIASLYAKIGADTAGFERGMRGVDSRMNRAGRAFGGVAKASKAFAVGIGIAGVAVGGVSAKLIDMGSDAEEMMGKFDIVFGAESDRMIRSLDQMGSALNRNVYDLRGFAATFQDTFVPLGFARKDAADMSTQLTKLTVDIASFNNAAEPDVLNDLQSAIVGNHETMRKYGVIITQATLDQELLKMGIEGGTRAASEMEKAQARLNVIMAGTSDAQGDAARTADSWANQMRGLQATFSETATAIGSELLPVVAPLLKDFATWARDVAPSVVAGFSSIIDIVRNRDWGGLFAIVRDSAAGWATDLWADVSPKINAMWRQFSSWITNPLRLTEMSSWISTTWTGFTDWASGVWDNISPKLVGMWNSLSDWVTDPKRLADLTGWTLSTWTGFTDWAADVWTLAQPKLLDMWGSLSTWVQDPMRKSDLGTWVTSTWTGFITWAGDIWDNIKLKLSSMWTSVSGWVTDPVRQSELSSWVSSTWTGFTVWASAVWDNISPKLVDMWSSLDSWVSDPNKQQSIKTVFELTWTSFESWAANVWGNVKPKLDSMYGSLTTWINTNIPQLSPWIEAFEQLTVDINSGWSSAWPKIAKIVSDFESTVTPHIEGVMESLQTLIRWGDNGNENAQRWGHFFVKIAEIIARTAEEITASVDMILTSIALIKSAFTGDQDIARQSITNLGERLESSDTIVGQIFQAQADFWRSVFDKLNVTPGATGFGDMEYRSLVAESAALDIYIHGDNLPEDSTAIDMIARRLMEMINLNGVNVVAP